MTIKKIKPISCLFTGIGALCFVFCVGILGLYIVFMDIGSTPIDYETLELENYGNYIGVEEKWQREYITRFFPETLLPEFENIQYTFHSRTVDTYGFEAYLEFTFADTATFDDYVEQNTRGMKLGTFYLDNAYQEYVLQNDQGTYQYDHLSLSNSSFKDESGVTHYYIDFADVAKILVDRSNNRMIYIVIAVFDGGGTDTELLDAFFTRFDIAPLEYERYTKQTY